MPRQLLLLSLAALLLLSSLALADEPVMEETRDGLLLHMSRGPAESHRVLMPLNLAMMMKDHQPVRLFLDIEAVHVVTKDAPAVTHEGFDKTSLELITGLLEAGVDIHVCPMCMKAAGVTEDDLLPGVQTAKPDTFTGFTSGRVVTLDW